MSLLRKFILYDANGRELELTTQSNAPVSIEELGNDVSTNSNTQQKVSLYGETGNATVVDANGYITSIIKGTLDGTILRTPRMDSFSNELIVIQNEHHQVHEGELFFYKRSPDLVGGVDSVTYFMFTTPDTTEEIHAKALFPGSQVEFLIEIYRDPTTTADGTPIDFVNANGNSVNTSNLLGFAAPTVTADGTLLWQGRVGSGKTSGVSNEIGYEIVAARNTKYIFKITKKTTTSPAWIDIDFFFYQEAAID